MVCVWAIAIATRPPVGMSISAILLMVRAVLCSRASGRMLSVRTGAEQCPAVLVSISIRIASVAATVRMVMVSATLTAVLGRLPLIIFISDCGRTSLPVLFQNDNKTNFADMRHVIASVTTTNTGHAWQSIDNYNIQWTATSPKMLLFLAVT